MNVKCFLTRDQLIPYTQATNLPDTQGIRFSNDTTGGPLEATDDPLLAATRGPLVLLFVACQQAASSLHVGYYYYRITCLSSNSKNIAASIVNFDKGTLYFVRKRSECLIERNAVKIRISDDQWTPKMFCFKNITSSSVIWLAHCQNNKRTPATRVSTSGCG